MRINTANQFDRSIEILQSRQQSLQSAQERLTSGKRIARPSDDPTGAARAERALAQEARIEARQRALEASRNAMSQAETALGDASDLMQRARELVVQAGNASYADAQRRSIAEELRDLRQQLLGVANRSDGAGGYDITTERTQLHQKIVKDEVADIQPSQDPTFHMHGGGPATCPCGGRPAGPACP